MLVSQLIYTACGRNRNHGYDVFTKSEDITKDEELEIVAQLRYPTRELGLSLQPTEDQIKNYPKRVGFFKLNSGRFCFAQSVYIGKMYSDEDGRLGNFLIHAFVSEDASCFNALSNIEAQTFIEKLEYKTWHDDPIPANLSKVEINNKKQIMTEVEIRTFLNSVGKDKLKYYLQGVINSLENDENIIYCDTFENEKKWIKLLSFFIPDVLQSKLSYLTCYDSMQFVSRTSEVKIKREINKTFNYSMEIRKGKYVYDFINNNYNNEIIIGNYVNTVINQLYLNFFNTITFIEKINSYIRDYGLSIENAVHLFNINSNKSSQFTSLDEFNNLLESLKNVPILNQNIVNSIVFNNIIEEKKWGFTKESNNMLKRIYSTLLDEKKNKVIEYFFNNISSFSSISEYTEYINTIKINIPFPLKDAIPYFETNLYKIIYQKDFNYCLMVFEFYINKQQVDPSFKKVIQTIFNFYLDGCRYAEVNQLLNTAKKYSQGLGEQLLQTAINEFTMKGQEFGKKFVLNDAFVILELSNNISFQSTLFINILSSNDKNEFIKIYEHHYSANQSLYSKLEEMNKNHPIVKDLIDERFLKVLNNKSRLTERDIIDIYNKAKNNEISLDIFIAKFEKYLDESQYSSKNILEFYEKNFDKEDNLKILKIIENKVYKCNHTELFNLYNNVLIRPILIKLNRKISDQTNNNSYDFETLDLCVKINKSLQERRLKQELVEEILESRLYSEIKRIEQIDCIVEVCMEALLNIFYDNLGCGKPLNLLHLTFTKLTVSKGFETSFNKVMDKFKDDKKAKILSKMCVYTYLHDGKIKGSEFFEMLFVNYLSTLSGKESKKIITLVSNELSNNYKKQFDMTCRKVKIEEEGFFSKLFGKKK